MILCTSCLAIYDTVYQLSGYILYCTSCLVIYDTVYQLSGYIIYCTSCLVIYDTVYQLSGFIIYCTSCLVIYYTVPAVWLYNILYQLSGYIIYCTSCLVLWPIILCWLFLRPIHISKRTALRHFVIFQKLITKLCSSSLRQLCALSCNPSTPRINHLILKGQSTRRTRLGIELETIPVPALNF